MMLQCVGLLLPAHSITWTPLQHPPFLWASWDLFAKWHLSILWTALILSGSWPLCFDISTCSVHNITWCTTHPSDTWQRATICRQQNSTILMTLANDHVFDTSQESESRKRDLYATENVASLRWYFISVVILVFLNYQIPDSRDLLCQTPDNARDFCTTISHW